MHQMVLIIAQAQIILQRLQQLQQKQRLLVPMR